MTSAPAAKSILWLHTTIKVVSPSRYPAELPPVVAGVGLNIDIGDLDSATFFFDNSPNLFFPFYTEELLCPITI